MSTRTLRRQADELLQLGFTRQQAFDLLLADHPTVKPKRLADLLRNRPTQLDRERHQGTVNLLLGIMVVYAVLSVVHEFQGQEFRWMGPKRYLMLVPVATILLGLSVYRWQGQVFRWVGWMNLLGAVSLFGTYTAFAAGEGDAWPVVLDSLSVLIGGLALYLAIQVFPKYSEEPDPLGGAKRYVFPEQSRFFR